MLVATRPPRLIIDALELVAGVFPAPREQAHARENPVGMELLCRDVLTDARRDRRTRVDDLLQPLESSDRLRVSWVRVAGGETAEGLARRRRILPNLVRTREPGRVIRHARRTVSPGSCNYNACILARNIAKPPLTRTPNAFCRSPPTRETSVREVKTSLGSLSRAACSGKLGETR